jgi:hypothetical protein
MSWTKRQLVTQALEEIGLAAYVFDLSADQMNSARIKLDAMMSSWNARGIKINYSLPTNQDDSDLDQDSGVPDAAYEAIYKNLAIQLAPSYGKQISPDTRISAKLSLDALIKSIVIVPTMKFPTSMPLGAGYKSENITFVQPTDDNILSTPNNTLEFVNGN